MVQEAKIPCRLEDGTIVQAQAPVIVSASRSTDIPAFYADWFFDRLRAGYSLWKNPFNGKSLYVSYKNTRFIVFWSKNPRPLLGHLNELKDRGIGCYIQFSLNDYVAEGYEPNVPSVEARLNTFSQLVDKLGRGGVIWRNDPLLLTQETGVDELLRKTERLGDALKGLTEKLVFSYADITRAVSANLKRANIAWREWSESDMLSYAKALARMNEKWGYELATCAEEIELTPFGIQHNHCIDEKLIIRRGFKDAKLMQHLGVTISSDANSMVPMPRPSGALDLGGGKYAVGMQNMKDQGQRKRCGCIKSKDIGEYSTCRHFCVYCYANGTHNSVLNNWAAHRLTRNEASITGHISMPKAQSA
ncbi:MAG: DUF1848 domain-containing protein [Desulfovibrionaceae bacterium]|nr:DUF1848 domain-containing protein [Desulfovibrionaceae bacterium]